VAAEEANELAVADDVRELRTIEQQVPQLFFQLSELFFFVRVPPVKLDRVGVCNGRWGDHASTKSCREGRRRG
jgi:hypothetical protein